MKKRALIYIILSGILWGTSGLFVDVLTPYGLSAFQITAIRAIVSAICMFSYVLFYNRRLLKARWKEVFVFALSGITIFLTSGLYFLSMQASSVSTAVVLMYTAPIFVMIYSVSFLGEKFTLLKFISLILVMCGSFLVSGIIGGFKYSVEGIVFGFGAGFAYSAYNIITKIAMRNKSNPLSASMYSFIFMALAALVFSKPAGIVIVAAKNPSIIFYMVLCGLCTCVFPYFLYTLSLRHLPVGTASALGIVEPVAATLFSIIFLGEKLGIFTSIGIVLVLTAVVLLSIKGDE